MVADACAHRILVGRLLRPTYRRKRGCPYDLRPRHYGRHLADFRDRSVTDLRRFRRPPEVAIGTQNVALRLESIAREGGCVRLANRGWVQSLARDGMCPIQPDNFDLGGQQV